MEKPNIDLKDSDWRNWSVRIPVSLLAVIITGLWVTFNFYRDQEELRREFVEFRQKDEDRYQVLHRRINNIRDRHEGRLQKIEDKDCE